MPLLSVGFCSRTFDELTADDVRRVMPAERLTLADAGIAERGARVTVHGFFRAAAYRNHALELGLRTYYPAIDPATGAKAPVITWAWRGESHRVSSSNRTAFTVPVDDALHLGVERRIDTPRQNSIIHRLAGLDAPRSDSRAELAELVAHSGVSGMKLRRGTYFLAVRESDADAAPSWSSLRVTRDSASALRTTMGGDAPFSYLVLSIEAVKA